MSQLSDHAEALILNWFLTNGAATRPTAWYLALFTAAPNDAGGGTEVSGAGYSRQSVTFGAASSPGGTAANTNTATFTASGGSFGTVTHCAVFDASSGGNMLFYGALPQPETINNTNELRFPIGEIVVTLG
jgi:hypothetical protein